MWKKLSDISLLNNEEKRYNLPPKVEDQEGHPGLSDSNNPQIPHFRPESEHKEKDIEIQYNDALNPTLLPTDAKDMLEFPSKSNKVWVGGDHLDFDPEKSLAPYILQTTDSGSARTVYHSFSDINNIDELIKHASEITPEMEEWFEERTNKHIGLVQKYCKRIYEYDPERFEEILELGKEHDQSKFKDPERTPYIKLTWKHKFDNYDSYKKPGTLDDKEINRATVLHVKNNEHHPEHWTNQTNDLINEEDRDKPPDKIIDATKMPDINIGTMCADWAAMSEELENNTPREWADKNVNIRWKFNDAQRKLIYELIDAIWGDKEAQLLEKFLKTASVEKLPLNIPISDTLKKILESLQLKGLQGLIVGGSVRDALLGMPPKDIDIEVYGAELETLLGLLNNFGKAHVEGKSFGVIKLRDTKGNDYDFSIPRRDSKSENDPTNIKGRGITVELDKDMPVDEAASRRDYTINAMAYNPLTQELHDYFGGLSDLQNKVLKATSPAFLEDPLRVLRGMQFAARFGMTVDPKTAEMCKSIKHMPLQKDRVRDEFMKFFTKCKEPSKGLQFLIDTEWIDNYPELKGIVGVQQDLIHHPEGTVDAHTQYTLDAASRIADEGGFTGEEKAILIASALCHDLGKASTTAVTEEGRVTSYGHHEEGAKLTKSFLGSIGVGKDVTEPVVALVGEHMSHIFFDPKSRKSTVMHLAERLNKATIKQLEAVIQSDMAGRPPLSTELPESAKVMLDLAKEKGVYEGKAQPLISGKDLLAISPTIRQGEELGQILREIKQKQLEGTLNTKEEALEYAKKILPKYFSFIKGGDVLAVLGGQGGPVVGEILQNVWNAQLSGEIKNREEALQWLQQNYSNTTEAQLLEEFVKVATKEERTSSNPILNKAIELHNISDTLREEIVEYASERQFDDPSYMYDRKMVQRQVFSMQDLINFWNENVATLKKELHVDMTTNEILNLRQTNAARYMDLSLKSIDRGADPNSLDNASVFSDNAQNEIHNAIKVFLRLEQEETAISKDDEEAVQVAKLRKQTANINLLEEFLKFAETNYKIFCDLDGVLAGFNELFESFGHGTPDEFIDKHGEEAMWYLIMNNDPHFFYNEDWTPDGKELWDYIKQFNPTILTKITHIPKHCSEDKKKWVAEHLGKDVEVITTTKKEKYAEENAILIDDMEKNLSAWEHAGGIGIKHISAATTIKKLKNYMSEEK